MTIRGSLSSTSGLELAGSIEGDVEVDELTLGSSATIVGAVQGTEVVVEGSIRGDVEATKLMISTSGSVDGDVTATAVVIDEGGILEGRCHMGTPRAEVAESEPAAKVPEQGASPGSSPTFNKPVAGSPSPQRSRPKPAAAPA